MDQPEPAPPEIFPQVINHLLILFWLVLMGGRWVVGQALIAFAIVPADKVSAFDETVGLRCYLVLLMITLIHAALRMIRSMRRPVAASAESPSGAIAAIERPAREPDQLSR